LEVVEHNTLVELILILEHQSLLLVVEKVVLRHHHPSQVLPVDPVVEEQVVLVPVLAEQEVVIHSQDLLHLILHLMVGAMMVVPVAVVVLRLIVVAAVVVLQVQEQITHKETMVVEVCYSPPHLEIHLWVLLLDHLKLRDMVRPSQRVNTLPLVVVELEWLAILEHQIAMELVASVVVDGVVVIKVDQLKINLFIVELMQLQTLDLVVEEEISIMNQAPRAVLVDLVSFWSHILLDK
jgi:hypothetical protein